MSDVTVTRTTNLRGSALQNAVAAMINELSGQSPYSTVRMTQRWDGPARIILEAGNHMRGYVDIQDGSPSRVTANIDLLSGMARMYRDRVIRDINAIADSRLGGAPAAAATAAPSAAPAPASAPVTAAPAPTAEPRREYDPERAGAITTGIFGSLAALARGVTEGLRTDDARSTVLEQYALPELPAAPWERQPSAATTQAPVAPPVVTQPAPASPEYAVSTTPTVDASYYDYGKPQPAYVPSNPAPQAPAPPPATFPWGWVVAGVAAAVGVTAVAVVATRGQEG